MYGSVLPANKIERKKNLRNRIGSAFVAVVFATFFCIVPTGLLVCNAVTLAQKYQNIQSALDAAALETAKTLSEVTIDDPNFGYIGLSNRPPTNPKLKTSSGGLAPVLSINNLIGTVRLDLLLANQLGNETFHNLVMEDLGYSKKTILRLNSALSESVKDTPKRCGSNDSFRSGKELFSACLDETLPGGTSRIMSYEVEVGGLKRGVGTSVSTPVPTSQALCAADKRYGDYYRPCQDLPIQDEHFYFACVSDHPSLCCSDEFAPLPPDQPKSVVRLAAKIKIDLLFEMPTLPKSITLNFSACAKPGSLEERMPPGVLIVKFANGQVPGLHTLRDLITTTSLSTKQSQTYEAVNGNYPDDAPSMLVENQEERLTCGEAFTVALYDWIRNCHVRPNLNSLNAFLDYNFSDTDSTSFTIFDFAKDHGLLISTCRTSPFSPFTVSENQVLAQCNGSMDFPCQMIIRDEVRRLGNVAGGKDSGLAIPATLWNWCELAEFNGGPTQSHVAGKGGDEFNMTVQSLSSGTQPEFDQIFTDSLGKILPVQPRPTFYSGGLAVEICFGVKRN